MGLKVRTDFEWSYTDEPHATRRREILKKHPEIKLLMGTDPNFKFQVLAYIMVQMISVWMLKDSSWWVLLILAYCFGGVINHCLSLAIHDISHNVAFGNNHPKANRLFGMIANLPLGIPFSISFKKYHVEHHRFQGQDQLDPDLPTEFEAKLFNSIPTKICWLILQPVFYAFRPFVVQPLPVVRLEILNIIVQVIFDLFVCVFCGYRMLLYLIIGTILCMGLHPMAGHFLSEHYMLSHGFETFSYYGPVNYIGFNVGYHTEHHDFPSIPSSRLPLVRKIAKEFYDDLPYHDSLSKVVLDFILDPNINLYCRIKRKPKN